MKRLLAKIEEREKEIDRIHGAAERLAFSCLSDAELEILAGTGEAKEAEQRLEEIRAQYAACKTEDEARKLYLTFFPCVVTFDNPTETDLKMIGLSARMRSGRSDQQGPEAIRP